MKKYLSIILALNALHAHAMLCSKPLEKPEGAEVYPTCAAQGVFLKDGKYGFFDTRSGDILAPAQFDEVKDRYLAEQPTPVRQGEKWAYVDSRGTALTPYQYEDAEHFRQRALAIVRKDGRYGMVNERLETVVPFAYERMERFWQPEGSDFYLALACQNGKCGYLNDKGETAIALQYDDAQDFVAAVAPVKKSGKWGYIDARGNTVQPFVYDYAENFPRDWRGDRSKPCVMAEQNGKRTVIDPQGKILPPQTECPLLPPPIP